MLRKITLATAVAMLAVGAAQAQTTPPATPAAPPAGVASATAIANNAPRLGLGLATGLVERACMTAPIVTSRPSRRPSR